MAGKAGTVSVILIKQLIYEESFPVLSYVYEASQNLQMH